MAEEEDKRKGAVERDEDERALAKKTGQETVIDR
jgi:hypothetical protein